jgi:salicylate hydroxylase
VLAQLGFSFERTQAQPLPAWDTVHGASLAPMASLDFGRCVERYGGPFVAVHRVDLHRELLRLALDGGGADAARLRLGAAVAAVREAEGAVELQDGSVHRADLVVAADGLSSVARSAVVRPTATATASASSAFRFLIPTERLQRDPAVAKILAWKRPGVALLADTADTVNERHLVWYGCRG